MITRLSQNKLTFRAHFENHRFTSLTILQVQEEAYSTTRVDIGIWKEKGFFPLYNNYLSDDFN